MKGKIFALALCISAAAAVSVSAAELDGQLNGESLIINASEGMSERAAVVCYDGSGKLVYANSVQEKDGAYTITVPSEFETARLYDNGNTYDINIEEASATAQPAVSASPAISASPEATASPAVTAQPAASETPLPSVYENEADAVRAFYVVDEVSSYMDSDNADAYKISAYYQGGKTEVGVKSEIEIESAPDAYKELIGMNAGALQKGDVVVFSSNLARTEVRGIKVIYRITDIFDGEDYGSAFEKLISENGKVAGEGSWTVRPYGSKMSSNRYQYAFGIITDKSGSSFTLYPLSGRGEDAMEVDFESDTIVYTCDMDSRGREYEIEAASVSAITKSGIPSSAFDDEDNIDFTSDYIYNLALVRFVDGTAADVIVYQNVEY
jgi:hypothetical protein